MNKNLGWKLGLVFATLLFFLFGIFGIPKGFSGRSLLASLQDRIHLGLDLKGGTHLILQVQVNDAVNGDSDRAVDRLKEDLRTHKINYTEITKPDPANTPDQIVLKGVPPESSSDLRNIVSDRLPEYDLRSGAENTWILSMKPQYMADLKNRAGGASVGRDTNTNAPDVNFTLTNEGGRKFAAFTGAHVNDRLAVVLDNKVREVATINEQIHDQGRISGGGMTEQTAKDLALVLNSGALPASIKYLEERTVGPSLGSDSIRAGVQAAIIGMLAVLVFMLVYYRGAGINADVALILNLIILLGFLGYSGATLTLPGIAGVILTVGMGVDSNVLIFERIREELRNGKTPPSAVEQGFSHAWITIVDTHVTTIVSAAILFLFGTGPVKGFAVTLTFGLFANLFTAVFVSRMIFDWILSRKQRGEVLSI